MRLTLYTDYAVRVLLYLGERRERLCSVAEISQAQRVIASLFLGKPRQFAECRNDDREDGDHVQLQNDPAQISKVSRQPRRRRGRDLKNIQVIPYAEAERKSANDSGKRERCRWRAFAEAIEMTPDDSSTSSIGKIAAGPKDIKLA